MSQEIKDLAPRMPSKYLRDFFAEKDIPERIFEKEGPSGTNFIPNAMVVECMTRVKGEERLQIEDTLRKLDFHNADINHFLEHLSGALVQ